MTVETELRELRQKRLEVRDRPVPKNFQGVSKERIRKVLSQIDKETDDMVDVVYALLDNETENLFSSAPYDAKFCDGATVAHIGAHVGILQRGNVNKLDREGRDYWIKPLVELGAIEPIYLNPETNTFIQGHPKPKSPNSAYRLSNEFVEILKAPRGEWNRLLSEWSQEERIRERMMLQARAQEISEQKVLGNHKKLIMACKEMYIPNFLPGFEILFLDYRDGERITEDELRLLLKAGLSIGLGDPMPDVLLWNSSTDIIWIIEAVISDGEVDVHKVRQILNLTRRSQKAGVGFTTAYDNWNTAAKRQGRYKNIAPSTYIWIREDPSKQFLVSEMNDELKTRDLK